MTRAVLPDRVLLDLLENVEHAHDALDAVLLYDDVPQNVRYTLDETITTLAQVTTHLIELRERQHAGAAP